MVMFDRGVSVKIVYDFWQHVRVTKYRSREVVVIGSLVTGCHLPDAHDVRAQLVKGKSDIL
jgi:hypothetical protein